MCRILGYTGSPISMEKLLYEPPHSLVVQSHSPKEMTSGVANADGFGVGWYHASRNTDPFTYKHTLPIWSDVNLPSVSRYVESGNILGCVRSATEGQPVDMSNCQPFRYQQLMGVHNGFVKQFRQTLFRPLRDRLADDIYQNLNGTTDSEHMFALFAQKYQDSGGSLSQAMEQTLTTLGEMAKQYNTRLAANLVVSDGKNVIASRFASSSPVPSLYWIQNSDRFPHSIAIASEPLFPGNWKTFGERSMLHVGENLAVDYTEL